ncbi:hypothetical protein FC93_GL000912 [Lactobacillus kefiranofaciens subsp. kefiranofaciens DSM 5016 = JCM 6985]|nr:hypothetical protein FC93_GL000912 [Lactobacillus kefiranofaciens subsp. kefiranofaciens DSM 5016 = JCM 6985]
MIPAFFDLINALPVELKNTAFAQSIINFGQEYFPLFSMGFSWIIFSLVGLILGLAIYFEKKNKYISKNFEVEKSSASKFFF